MNTFLLLHVNHIGHHFSMIIPFTEISSYLLLFLLILGLLDIFLHLLQPHSLVQVSKHFCTTVSLKFESICPLQRPDVTCSNDVIFSLSYASFSSMLIHNVDHAPWMGHCVSLVKANLQIDFDWASG